MNKIKVAVVGLGNLGKACIGILKGRKEFELFGVFSRRAVDGALPLDTIEQYKEKIDVVLVCVGSSTDAPVLLPRLAKTFNTVDSFDTHAKLADYIKNIKKATDKSSTTAIVATGWDPGLLSLGRIYFDAFMASTTQTFWGPGVSLGHTNAIKGIDGVENAIQFTVPKQTAVSAAKKGIQLEGFEKHKRVCYVVAPSAKHESIETAIRTMPNYFAGYETEVHFVSQKEFRRYANRTEHAGQLINTDGKSTAHFKLNLKSNSHFTASVMIAYAIANFQLQKEKQSGVFTVADIAPKYLIQGDCINKV